MQNLLCLLFICLFLGSLHYNLKWLLLDASACLDLGNSRTIIVFG